MKKQLALCDLKQARTGQTVCDTRLRQCQVFDRRHLSGWSGLKSGLAVLGLGWCYKIDTEPIKKMKTRRFNGKFLMRLSDHIFMSMSSTPPMTPTSAAGWSARQTFDRFDAREIKFFN